MIINRDESEVAVLGEVQKYKVGIDERNINHIVTILSSNLYSHPMQSFLRETVSNAIDSHLEAGVDEPIIITITDTDLSIRDFGTGISPERFQEIYTNIGSSTKRQSNSYIGSFGIGRFSCLSVSDLANITSYYNGKAYYYVMNKDIDQLHIDLLTEMDTNEHNGVEVKIPFRDSLKTEDWRALSFIKNIYVEDARTSAYDNQREIPSAFNKRKIHSYKTFKVLNIDYPFSKGTDDYAEVLIGCIPYRVDFLSLWDVDAEETDWNKAFKSIYPCLNIGDVDITPNRESLLYSERTKKALRKAYTDTIEELKELWDAACNDEYLDFSKFTYAIKNHYRNRLPLTESVSVELPDELPYKATYKDFENCDFKMLKDVLHKFYYYSPDDYMVAIYNGRKDEMQKARNSIRSTIDHLLVYCNDPDVTVIAVPDAQGFSSKYIKGFISEMYGIKRVVFIKKPYLTNYRIKRFIRDCFGITMYSDSQCRHLILMCLREFLHWFDKHIKYWDIIHSEEYLQYKEDNKEEKVYVRSHTKIPYHIWYPSVYGPATESDTPNDLIKRLTRKHNNCRIVYAQLDNIFIEALRNINYPNLIIIGLSQSNYQLAEKGMFPSWVTPIEAIYSEDNRILQRMAALEYIRTKISIEQLCSPFPKYIRRESAKLCEWNNKYPHCSRGHSYDGTGAYHLLDIVPKNKYDQQIMALYHKLKPYMEKEAQINRTHRSNQSFFFWFLMKAKKFRLDYDYYKCVKEDIKEITNLL